METTTTNKHFYFEITAPGQTSEADATTDGLSWNFMIYA
jgi:hypothetical protein